MWPLRPWLIAVAVLLVAWDDFFRSIGVPEDELGGGSDIIEDPNG